MKTKKETSCITEEHERDARLHTRRIKMVMDRLRRALTLEYYKKKENDNIRNKFIMTPERFLDKSYTRMSLTDLYRRYRRIRIMALTEALGIAGNSKSRQETTDKIGALIMEAGKAEKQSKENFAKEEKEKKSCVAY